MITFVASILLLIAGYFVYGKVVEKAFGISDKNQTPAITHNDGVDYVPLKPWRVFVIQFLNIAGMGPIFGAILGAAYGPAAYLWIVIGCIFMGAVMDYMSGMLSLRNDGASLPAIVGKYMGRRGRMILAFLTMFLMIAVGASFTSGPADLLTALTGMGKQTWMIVIIAYYIVATLLPINKIIGKIYPVMGAMLLFMDLGVGAMLFIKGGAGELTMVELTGDTVRNWHGAPETNHLIPMMFIVISCGALSGFHATQSPMMARCITKESWGRPVFYGAMICEGIVAMIWATAAMAYFGGPEGLNAAAAAGKTPAIIVNEICNSWLGHFGAILAIVGVIVCPITSGDTAFRGLRLVIAEGMRMEQKKLLNRFVIALPIFAIAYFACYFDFSILWQYVGILNQILAALCLWTISVYFKKTGKCHWITTIPSFFITFMVICYLIVAPHKTGGFALAPNVGYTVSAILTCSAFIWFMMGTRKKEQGKLTRQS